MFFLKFLNLNMTNFKSKNNKFFKNFYTVNILDEKKKGSVTFIYFFFSFIYFNFFLIKAYLSRFSNRSLSLKINFFFINYYNNQGLKKMYL